MEINESSPSCVKTDFFAALIQCKKHGALFDPYTGACLGGCATCLCYYFDCKFLAVPAVAKACSHFYSAALTLTIRKRNCAIHL